MLILTLSEEFRLSQEIREILRLMLRKVVTLAIMNQSPHLLIPSIPTETSSPYKKVDHVH
jgi:hypothetical protein